jgi:phage gp36-like protein
VQALDDDGDGREDAFEAVSLAASGEVDAYLASRYAVPFETTPLVVKRAAIVLACSLCYSRRGVSDEANPWAKQAEAMRKMLTRIGNGEIALQVAAPAVAPAVPAMSIIVEESALGRGRLG